MRVITAQTGRTLDRLASNQNDLDYTWTFPEPSTQDAALLAVGSGVMANVFMMKRPRQQIP